MSKHVLYIATLFRKKSCSASIRNVALVNALVGQGIDVTVVTVKFPSDVLDDYLIEQLNSKVKLVELDAGPLSLYVPKDFSVAKASGSFLSKLLASLKQAYFFPAVDKLILEKYQEVELSNIDLVISSSDTKTSHVLAEKVLESSVVPWGQIWGDPWESDVGIRSGFTQWRARNWEKRLIGKADYIFYVSLPTLEEMKLKYECFSSKMNLLPRSFFKKVETQYKEKKQLFSLVYTGSLIGRKIEPIVGAINLYNKKASVKIELTILGKINQQQQTYVERSFDVNYRGSASLKDTLKAYEEADGLLFLSNKSGANQIPGKLYDYFGTNKPILALVEDLKGEVCQFIKTSNRCSVFENNASSIDLSKFIESVAQNHDILEQFSPEQVASKLISLTNILK